MKLYNVRTIITKRFSALKATKICDWWLLRSTHKKVTFIGMHVFIHEIQNSEPQSGKSGKW